jgi:pyocin large subunit-like protein
MQNPGRRLRDTPGGSPRTGWWDPDTGTMVIREGNGGTFFQPDRGYDYFLEQVGQ